MSQEYSPHVFGKPKESISAYTAKTFGWMFLGLLTTFGVALAVSVTGAVAVLYQSVLPFILLIAEVGVVLYLSARLHKLSIGAARLLFFVYAVLNGVTFGSLFVAYSVSSLVFVFGMTAVYFGIMALYGMFTKADLARIRSVLIFGLISLLILAVVSIFIPALNTGLCLLGVVIFVAFTAYDTQKIRYNYQFYSGDPAMLQKASIISALELYLDFINIFLYLLQLFGKRN